MVLCNSLALLDLHHPRPICKRRKVAVVHSNNNSSSSKCLHNRNLSSNLSVVLVVCITNQLVLVARSNKLVAYRQVAPALLQVHNNNNHFHRIKA